MTESALVTGATGVLGRHLCRDLDERGWDVHGLRRDSSDVSPLSDVGVTWHRGDVLDRNSIRAAVDGRPRVFHLAGVGQATADAATVRAVNARGTKNVLDASLDAGVERLVFTSTAGTRRNDGDGPADETDVAAPVSAYQAAKARAEDHVAAAVDDGLDAVTVHPTSVFGPGDRTFTARLLALALDPKMVAYLPGGASFVGVDDAVAGIVAAMERGETGEHYILGGENLAYGAALATIADRAGGYRPFVRVPERVVHAAGYAVAPVNALTGARLFPFGPDMARLSTRKLFYSAAKAERELGYDHRPLAAHVENAARWYARSGA